jgi:hypothetical protein
LQGDGLSPCLGDQADDLPGLCLVGLVVKIESTPRLARLNTVLRPRPRLPPVTMAILVAALASFSIDICVLLFELV